MTQELFAALVAAQAEMPPVEPNATNPHFKSKFVSLDHLIAKTRPVLNRHGLAIVQAPSEPIDGGPPMLRTMIVHTSGGSLLSEMPLILAKQDMQGLGAAITYARRYAWAAALGIASEEDDDGETASQPSSKPSTNTQVEDERGYMKQADPKAGRVTLARGIDDWANRMNMIGVPNEDALEWLRQACDAAGMERKWSASGKRANEVLLVLTALDRDLALESESPRATIRETFAAAFDGAAVDGPSWRIHASETDRPAQFGEPSAEELAEAESIPFGES